ncbi:hypothetical protein [Acaryochloris sp. IP29b_bin.137]|uniref:hypothetical protein n=1 Tax=Acaryochloris sp. IP29b_bin.137 TaxID=2969217 RepID=UPI002604FCF4|nr:hypothetical protein [Acaryochloris sp. IP29b_bin.137]
MLHLKITKDITIIYRRTFLLLGCLAPLVIGLGSQHVALSQSSSMNDVISQDITRIKQTNNQLTMVVWFAKEAIEKLGKERSWSEERIQRISTRFEPYIMLAVLSGRQTEIGFFKFQDRTSVLEKVTIIDSAGKVYRPLDDSRSSDPFMKIFIPFMQGYMRQMAGELGGNMHFLLFSARDAKGNLIADPTQYGKLRVKVGDQQLQYKLPLNSLLPKQPNTTTNQHFQKIIYLPRLTKSNGNVKILSPM